MGSSAILASLTLGAMIRVRTADIPSNALILDSWIFVFKTASGHDPTKTYAFA